MEVEFTARQGKISKALRAQAEEGLGRISRILGKTMRASVICGAQRHLQIVELTLKARLQIIVATGKADNLESALRQAVSHAEHQALRYRDRSLGRKRLPKEEKMLTEPPLAKPRSRAAEAELPLPNESQNGSGKAKTRASIAVHSFPPKTAVVEPHIVRSGDAIAIRPMTVEEAVKDTEFRDRELLIFRSPAGELFVLHRRRDGQMELVEIP
jgi:putative sigma-54 modulation protein